MSRPPRPPVTILTSGIGLGVYIPALLIQRQLAHAGVAAVVEVLEGCYTPDSLRRHIAHRDACRKNFTLAQMAHRMARGVEGNLDRDRIGALLESWATQGRTDFIVWSGFWLPVLEDYRRRVPHLRLNRDLCRIDAEVSASFKTHRDLEGDGAEIWLWNWREKAIVHEIPVTPDPPVPFAQRERRLVVHGGGWGLGTYTGTLPALARAGYALDMVSLVAMAQCVGESLGRMPQITLASPQVGEVTRYVANLDKAQSLLGYVPRIHLRDGIALAVAWNRETMQGS